jgi:peptidoglycan/LPS O-acetylase OafA/YrhL
MAQRQRLTRGSLLLVAAALVCALLTAWAALFIFGFALDYQHSMTTAALTSVPVLGLAICMAAIAISRLRRGPLGRWMIGLSALIGAGFLSLGMWSIWQDPGDAPWMAPPIFLVGAIFILLAQQSLSARQV